MSESKQIGDAVAGTALELGIPAQRVQLLASSPCFGKELLVLESKIESDSSLDRIVREIVILTALRRSRSEMEARRVISIRQGMTSELIEAIAAEDWTDPVFKPAQKAAFQYALQYDAGHLIHSTVIEAVREHFDEHMIVELAIVCGHYGSMARLAVGFRH